MTNLTSTLLFCGILWNATPLAAQNTWSALSMYGGGYVTDLVPHPTNAATFVAVTDVSGLFVTQDTCNNWKSLTAKIPKINNKYFRCRSFAFAPSVPTTMYYLSEGISASGICWKSTDNGVNWSQKSLQLPISGNGYARYAGATLLVHPTNANQIFVGGQFTSTAQFSGLGISTDGGASWQYLRTLGLGNAWITKLKFDPANTNQIFISASKNATVSNSTSGFWKYNIATQQLTLLSSQDIVDFDVDANKSTLISTSIRSSNPLSSVTNYKSTNGGSTWQLLTTPAAKYGLFAVAHPTLVGTWYFATEGEFNSNAIVTTANAGGTWNTVRWNASKVSYPNLANNFNPPFSNNMSCLLFRGNNAYVGDWYGVWKTSNANLPIYKVTTDAMNNSNWNWRFSVRGIHNMVQLRTSLHPTDSTRFFANLADISYYEGTYSGATMTHKAVSKVNSTTRIAFHKNQPSVGYLVGTQGENAGRIRKLDNKGMWVSLSSRVDGDFETLSQSITDLVLTPKIDTLIVGLVPKTSNKIPIYLSTDGGQNWKAWAEKLPDTETFFEIWGNSDHLLSDADGRTFYVWNAKGLYRRNLSELEWTKLTLNESGDIKSVVTHPINPKTLYITFGSNKIYTSTTRGNGAWKVLTLPTDEAAELLAVSKSGRIVVQTRNNQIQRLFLSNNYGTTWKPLQLTGFLRQVEGLAFLQEKKLLGWTGGNSGFITDLSSALQPDKEESLETPQKMLLFPNPTTQILTVELPEGASIATVFDATGRFILSQEAVALNNFLSLDVNALQAGIYFVRVGTKVGSFVKN